MDIEQLKSLPEKLRRLVLGQEAAEIGRGGVSQIARKYNVSRTTVTKGKKGISCRGKIFIRNRFAETGRRKEVHYREKTGNNNNYN